MTTSLVGLSQTGPDLASYIQSIPSLEYALLVGDSNGLDGVSASYIATYKMWDRSLGRWVTTDAPYGDRDGDGLSDIAVGRWPVHSSSEAATCARKSIAYDYQSPSESYRQLLTGFVNDLEANLVDPVLTSDVGDDLVAATPNGMFGTQYKASSIPCCLAEREATLVNVLNAGTHIVTLLGTGASRHNVVGFLNNHNFLQGQYCPPPGQTRRQGFDLGLLAANNASPVWLALSCHLADFDGPFDAMVCPGDPSLGYIRPIAERLLVAENKGALMWFGPSSASYQLENRQMGIEVLSRIDQGGSMSVGQACMEAAKAMVQWRRSSRVRASSYVFLGDPTIRLSWASPTDVSEDVAPLRLGLSVYPNPGNGSSRFSISLPAQSTVSLIVYDIAGRRVRSVLAGSYPIGTYTFSWNHRNDRGARVATGIYVVRLRADGQNISKRVVVLK